MSDVWIMRAVAAAVFFILLFMIGVLCFVVVPKENHDIVLSLVSLVTGSATSIVGFYFGSSSSSRDKDQTLKQKLLGG